MPRLVWLTALLAACAPATPGARQIDFLGDGKADGAGPSLPDCAGPLYRAAFQAARKVSGHGTFPARYLASQRNRFSPRVLRDENEIFGAMAELIATAQYEVDLQTYSWRGSGDRVGAVLHGLVKLAARRAEHPTGEPVIVRILVDTMTTAPGGSGLVTSVMPMLSGQIESLALDPALVRVEIGAYIHTGVGALHSKTLVVDGRAAIITGANVNETGEHDAGFLFEGEVAVSLLADFDDAWRMGWVWICGTDRYRPLPDCAVKAYGVTHTVLDPEGAIPSCLPTLVASRPGTSNPFSNDVDNPQDQVFLAAFAGAQEKLLIETPNLNDDAAKQAILSALKRGVTVELVLAKLYEEQTESLPGQGGPNAPNVAELFARLAEAGVTDACQRLRIRWYSEDGIVPVEGNVPHANHVKYASVDGQLAIVGSANMDTQSWNKSREVNVVVEDAEIVAAWDQQQFEIDFARGIPIDQCP